MADAMVWFEREGKDVVACANTDLPNEKGRTIHYPLRWTCNNSAEAALVVRYLQDRMDKVIETIRRDAYHKGWKDAKAKRRKATGFTSWFGKADGGGCW